MLSVNVYLFVGNPTARKAFLESILHRRICSYSSRLVWTYSIRQVTLVENISSDWLIRTSFTDEFTYYRAEKRMFPSCAILTHVSTQVPVSPVAYRPIRNSRTGRSPRRQVRECTKRKTCPEFCCPMLWHAFPIGKPIVLHSLSIVCSEIKKIMRIMSMKIKQRRKRWLWLFRNDNLGSGIWSSRFNTLSFSLFFSWPWRVPRRGSRKFQYQLAPQNSLFHHTLVYSWNGTTMMKQYRATGTITYVAFIEDAYSCSCLLHFFSVDRTFRSWKHRQTTKHPSARNTGPSWMKTHHLRHKTALQRMQHC